jgi:hypothetical protein|tara:strand:- start:6603 stop:6893 length:291 start_codon:yes stop_codon:yes gene_type:complete
MNTIRDYKALTVVTNVEQGAIVQRLIEENKYLKSIVDFQVERYDKLVELYEEIEGDNHPGFQELSDIMDKLVQAGLCKNTKYWSSKDFYPDPNDEL